VSLAGTLTPKVWTDREGHPRPALDLVASRVLTAYQVKRKREAVTSAEQPSRKLDASARPADYRAPAPAAETDADGWPASDQLWN
jgi:hypothetical protein